MLFNGYADKKSEIDFRKKLIPKICQVVVYIDNLKEVVEAH